MNYHHDYQKSKEDGHRCDPDLSFETVVNVGFGEVERETKSPYEHEPQDLGEAVCWSLLLVLPFRLRTFHYQVLNSQHQNHQPKQRIGPEKRFASSIHF